MVNKLIEGRRWAEGIRDCLHKAENWSSLPGSDSEKVRLDCVNELLGFDRSATWFQFTCSAS